MVELSVSVEGLFGLTWPQWKRLVRSVEDLGFTGLYLSDHFNMPEPTGAYPSLELVVALTTPNVSGLARWSRRSPSVNP